MLISGKAGSCCSGAAEGHACSPDCPGAKEALFGDVLELKDGRLKLALELAPGNVILAGEYFPTPVGMRTYLVPTDEMATFKRALTDGKDARAEAAGRFLVRQDSR